MSLSQPNTPRPEASQSHPLTPSQENDSTTDNNSLHKRRVSNFSTSSFQSLPYPTSPTRNRRRTESSSFFETGPTFTPTKQLLEIWNMEQTNSYQVQLHVKMDRGFFRTEQDWTCYRRNYFQLSATFDVHGMNYLIQGPEVPCLIKDDQHNTFFQADCFSIGILAFVAGGGNEKKKVDLIQHTPKRDKGPQMTPQPRALRAGGNLHLAPVGSNHNIVTFERMQFKTATANNGKRRAAQQYYEIVVDLYANNTSNGHSIRVATCTSAPLVVRGRSPGHYADNNNNNNNNQTNPSSRHRHHSSDTILHDHPFIPSISTSSTSSSNSTLTSPTSSFHHPLPPQSLSTPLPSQPMDRYVPPPPPPPLSSSSRYIHDYNPYPNYPPPPSSYHHPHPHPHPHHPSAMIPTSSASSSSSSSSTNANTVTTHQQTNEQEYVISSHYPPPQQNYYSSPHPTLPPTTMYQQSYQPYIPSNYHPYNNSNNNNNNNNNNDNGNGNSENNNNSQQDIKPSPNSPNLDTSLST
ncbi:unnamed protein product [Cunninghamella echinulata]